MSLATVPGGTMPTLATSVGLTPVFGSSQPGANGVLTGMTRSDPNDPWYYPDGANASAVLVVYINDAVATVTSVSGLSASWTKCSDSGSGTAPRVEVWQANNLDATNTGAPAVTMSASVPIAAMFAVVNNSDGIKSVAITTGAGSGPMVAPTVTPGEENVLGLAGVVQFTTTDFQYPTFSRPATNNSTPANWMLGGFLGINGKIRASGDAVPNYSGVAQFRSLSTDKVAPWGYVMLAMRSHAVQVDDYTYQHGDTGALLNDPNDVAPPFYDIEKVSGLSDVPIVSEQTDLDGVDGGIVTANFYGPRTVVLEGTLYANAPVSETIIDDMKTTFAPSTDDKPLHIKPAGVPRRVLLCKVTDFKSDIDNGRARGVIPFQLSLQAGDPRLYSDWKSAQLTRNNSTNLYSTYTVTTVSNLGTTVTYPVIYIRCYSTEAATTIKLTNKAWFGPFGNTVTFDVPVASGSTVNDFDSTLYAIDMGQRRIYNVVTGAGVAATSHGWWGLVKGGNRITLSKAVVASVPEPATLYYRDAYI